MKKSIISTKGIKSIKGSLLKYLTPDTLGTHDTLDTLKRGQSLFEVIVALGMTAMVLVGAISLSTVSVRNSTFARNDAVATKYAQEALEWLREQRDTDWSSFYNNASGTKCISNPPAWGGSDLCSIQVPFRRGARFTRLSSDEIRAVVVVQWTDGQGVHEVSSATVFTRWK